MERSVPNLIVWAAPVMFALVLMEWLISRHRKNHLYHKKESIGSITVGIGNVIINSFLKVFLFSLLIMIYDLVPWRMYLNWWTLPACYIIFDFCSYLAHRISHQQRFWWATHVVHHSSENYNLTVSFRLSWMQNLKLIFFLPVAFMAFHPVIFFITSQVAVLFQFWVHTEYIRKMPRWVEYIFATPSNHRVHHGSQAGYLNSNYGATFIVWDRIFGTYVPETEQARYGITGEVTGKDNALHLNFDEYREMWKDVSSAKGLKDKWFFVFGDPLKIAAKKNTYRH